MAELSGVGLVPSGQAGTGTSVVFDPSPVIQSLARLGGRMDNIEKMKLLAAAKQKEAKTKAAEITKLEKFAPTVGSGLTYNAANYKLQQDIIGKGFDAYQKAVKAGDNQAANQIAADTDYEAKLANNVTLAQEEKAKTFWDPAKGTGKFFKPDTAIESNIVASSFFDPATKTANTNIFAAHDPIAARESEYIKRPDLYNYTEIGKYAMDQAGKMSWDMGTEIGTKYGGSKPNLFQFQTDKNGNIIENAELIPDTELGSFVYRKNPITSAMMDNYSNQVMESEVQKSPFYKDALNKAAAGDTKDIDALKLSYKKKGESEFVTNTLRGMADATVKADAEKTRDRAMAVAKAGWGAKAVENVSFGYTPINAKGTFASPIAGTNNRRAVEATYNFGGQNKTWSFPKDKQPLGPVKFYPMGDPRPFVELGILKPLYSGGAIVGYQLNTNIELDNVQEVDAVAIGQKRNSQGGYEMPEGVVKPTTEASLSTDKKLHGYYIAPDFKIDISKIDAPQAAKLKGMGYDVASLSGMSLRGVIDKNDAGPLKVFVDKVEKIYNEQNNQPGVGATTTHQTSKF